VQQYISSTVLTDQKYPAVVVGIRGLYKDMGNPQEDDRGVYDNAIFLDTPSVTAAYNGNINLIEKNG
jgi:hypothetical protein